MSGAIMTAQLHDLHNATEAGKGMSIRALIDQGIQQIEQLPFGQREVVVAIYRHAISTTFLIGSFITAAAFTVVLFLPEHPLKSSYDANQEKQDGSATH